MSDLEMDTVPKKDRDVYYLLYPKDYKKAIIGIDYDKYLGYVFVKSYTSNLGTIYFRSIYPEADTIITIDKRYFEDGKSGMRCAMGKDLGCVLHDIPYTGKDTMPKCRWYGCDGQCFFSGAGCSPQYREYSALIKWGVPLDDEREKTH